MAGPYDYTVNIPQPPAQNFLQGLTGIMQIRQMQDQSAIQQQQAAIQQQQAQFAQELQPLERQKLEAAIAAQRANTAQSMASRDVTLEGLRQSKQTFAEQEEIKKQEKLLREDIMGLAKDPTLATQEKLQDVSTRTAFLLPKSYEPLQRMFEDFPRAGKVLENTASDVIFAVQSGQPKVAVASVNKQLEAAQNSLQINPDDKEAKATVSLLEGVKSQMDEGKYGEAMVSASIFLKNQNPRKWNAVTGDLQELGKATKAVAEAKKEDAATEGQLLDNRIKKYEADNGMSIKDIAKNKEERFKTEAAERTHIEAQPFVRQYLGKREAFDMMKTAELTGVGDKVLLVQFTKMGDPTSIVSVTEEGSSRNITMGDYIASLEARIKSTGSLGNQQRKELKDQAFQMLKTSEKAYKEYTGNLEPVYRERGLNPKNIFVLPSSEQLREEARQQTVGPTSEEARIRSMLRPAAGFGNTMTPSQIQPQGGTFQGTPTDVDAILKQFGVR